MTPLRFLTWNLRYDSFPNAIPVSESISSLPRDVPADTSTTFYATATEAPWSSRRIVIARDINFTTPQIVCFQEVLYRQFSDLTSLLPSYTALGVGRDDGHQAGEYEAIFYKHDELELLEWDTFWLSSTPESPSKFPGAGSVRTATRARFRTGERQVLTVICTHWDEQSDAARQLAASLILRRAQYEAEVTSAPVFVLGDFNSPSDGPDAAGYKIVTGARKPVDLPEEWGKTYPVKEGAGALSDLAQQVEPLGRSGHQATFTDFKRHGDMELKRIDFCMAGGHGWTVERYRVGESWWDNQSLASDHRPVWVDVTVG